MKILAFAAVALVSGVCVAGAPAEDIGGTVMPHGLGSYNGDTDKIAKRLREVKRRGDISRFVMSGPGHTVRVNGMMDVAGYAALGRRIDALQRKVAPDGILVGYKMMPTTNCGINHPWRKFTLSDGKVRAFTACPGDEGFRKDFAAKCAAVAGAGRPFLYLMDDDFRYFTLGCFCEDHLRRFAEISGVPRGREELVKALRAEGVEGQKIRMAWHRLQTGALLRLAKAASAAVRSSFRRAASRACRSPKPSPRTSSTASRPIITFFFTDPFPFFCRCSLPYQKGGQVARPGGTFSRPHASYYHQAKTERERVPWTICTTSPPPCSLSAF